ncbi:MAG TPA: hypothetical protein PKN13_11935 [Accumulibacter sp.]|nr:hypothetical protein [Accumulibacter sp.]HMW18716.1 hypothetical protein [Accumulibacter sp.]HMX23297.1 hypothetical protein [Accumulibacter sp.]HNC18585.1 hypothetical protein [Accumulibacter sp.]HND81358.1 hypothetical protein [Accumulibacter sp.]
MPNIVVVCHSGDGHTQGTAEKVANGTDEMLPGDLETARQFGERVTAVVQHWVR